LQLLWKSQGSCNRHNRFLCFRPSGW